jgi:hypothetical protein
LTNSAQLATESGGGGLPPERETQQAAAASKTKEMDPLERVLIVAVSAAAAAAGKYQKMEEFCRLRNAVDARVSKSRFPCCSIISSRRNCLSRFRLIWALSGKFFAG